MQTKEVEQNLVFALKLLKYVKEEGLPFYLINFKCKPDFEKECVRKDCAFKIIFIFLLLIYKNTKEKFFINEQKQSSVNKISNIPLYKTLNKLKKMYFYVFRDI